MISVSIKIAITNTFAAIIQGSLQFVDNCNVRFPLKLLHPTTIEMEINAERRSGTYLRKGRRVRRRMRSKGEKSEVLA